MRIEALVSFCGVLCMTKGEIREYGDENVLADLLSAGYVREAPIEPKQKEPTPKRSVKKNDSQGD